MAVFSFRDGTRPRRHAARPSTPPAAWATGLAKFNGIASSPPPMTYLFEFDLSAAMTAGMSTVIFTLLFIDFFDTAGTLTSVANVAGKIDKQGKVQDINKITFI